MALFGKKNNAAESAENNQAQEQVQEQPKQEKQEKPAKEKSSKKRASGLSQVLHESVLETAIDQFKSNDAFIPPPYISGFILFSSSSFPYNTPTPVGPHILCAENARKSISRSCTSTFICGTL